MTPTEMRFLPEMELRGVRVRLYRGFDERVVVEIVADHSVPPEGVRVWFNELRLTHPQATQAAICTCDSGSRLQKAPK